MNAPSDQAPAACPTPHEVGYDCLEGGHRGYQAVCWTCGWRGPERLRGDEEMGTDESRAHKLAAKRDMLEHRAQAVAQAGEQRQHIEAKTSGPSGDQLPSVASRGPSQPDTPAQKADSEQDSWPQEILVCSICGGALDGRRCVNGHNAYPAKPVEVIPASSVADLQAERDELRGQRNRAWEQGDDDWMAAMDRAEAAERERDELRERIEGAVKWCEERAEKHEREADSFEDKDQGAADRHEVQADSLRACAEHLRERRRAA